MPASPCSPWRCSRSPLVLRALGPSPRSPLSPSEALLPDLSCPGPAAGGITSPRVSLTPSTARPWPWRSRGHPARTLVTGICLGRRRCIQRRARKGPGRRPEAAAICACLADRWLSCVLQGARSPLLARQPGTADVLRPVAVHHPVSITAHAKTQAGDPASSAGRFHLGETGPALGPGVRGQQQGRSLTTTLPLDEGRPTLPSSGSPRGSWACTRLACPIGSSLPRIRSGR